MVEEILFSLEKRREEGDRDLLAPVPLTNLLPKERERRRLANPVTNLSADCKKITPLRA